MENHSENYKVEYYDVDAFDNIKISSLSNLMLQISNNQLLQVGMGAHELVEKMLGWVVIQFHFEINRLPKMNEEIVISTKPTGYNRFFTYRDYEVKTTTGETLITVNSSWIIMDLAKREMIQLTDQLGEDLDIPEIKRGPKFPKMKFTEDFAPGFEYRIRYYDLDANRHVNNSHYFEWMVDQLPLDIVENYHIKTFDIKFDQELRFGDHPQSQIVVEFDGDKAITKHLIKNGDALAASGMLAWEKNN